MYYEKLSNLGIKLSRRSGSEKTRCPQCSDARKNKKDKCLSVNITTGEYNCHNPGCGFKGNVRAHERKRENKNYAKPPQHLIKSIELQEKVVEYFAKRKISKTTLDKFFIFSKKEWMPATGKEENCVCFPYMRDSEIVNVKYRDGAKNFRMVKDAELIFFNLQSIGEKKHCIIVEGEVDCLSLYEVGFGRELIANGDGEPENYELAKWCILSVPNGAAIGEQKLEYLDNCSEYLEGIEEFIIATDGDEAGLKLRDELIRRLGAERCKTINYPPDLVVFDKKIGGCRACKDSNEVLDNLSPEALVKTITDAQFIPVEGVWFVEDIFPSMLQNFRNGVQLAPTTRFASIDEYFRWKKGEINLWVGYGNHGKTTMALQMMLTKSIWDGWKWGVFSPENYPANDFYDDIIEMYCGKWLTTMDDEEYTNAANFINDHIFYIYPEDDHDLDAIHEKFRYLVLKKGIDGVLLDPWNQLDHLQKAYQRDDQYLSERLKEIKRFSLINNISYNIIAHPNKPTYGEGKQLPVVDMYDVNGGAMWGNKADQILSYYRPNYHVDKNDPYVQLHSQKVKRKRTGGRLGYVDLRLNWGSKRFEELPNNTSPCDPKYAKRMLSSATTTELNFNNKQNLWLPYADDKEDIDF